MIQYPQINQYDIYHINKIKNKNCMIISPDACKANVKQSKIRHPFMIKKHLIKWV